MKPVSLRWHLAAAVLVVSIISVTAGAGAMLVAGHAQAEALAEATLERHQMQAAAEINEEWHRIGGRLLVLASALDAHPSNESFGQAVGHLGLLDGAVNYVAYRDDAALWVRPAGAVPTGPVVTLDDGGRLLHMGIDERFITGIIDRYNADIPPPASIAWDSDGGPAENGVGFGGVIIANPGASSFFSFDRDTVMSAAGTGAAVAVFTAGAAAVAATLVVRPLRRFEADVRALSDGRAPPSRRGPKELAGLANTMQEAASQVARERHELQVAQEKLGAHLRRQTRAVAEQETRFRRLFEGISHDIKGPLITANVLLQQVQRESTGEQERLDRAIAALHRLRALVYQLGLLSRASTKPKLAPFDLAPLVQKVVEDARQANHNGRIVQWSGPDLVLRSDAERIGIALAMLVDNGLRHGGNVRVQWAAGPVPCIRIMDDGPGFPFTQDMFEPFAVRGDQPGVAAGLGLAIAHRLVRSVGGGLQVASSASGTRCAIFLPEGL